MQPNILTAVRLQCKAAALIVSGALLGSLLGADSGGKFVPNQDESKVPAYRLPDPPEEIIMNSTPSRFFHQFVKLLCMVASLPLLAGEEAVSRKPNVLFIMADDFNTALSGYGHPQCKTPNLDKLAALGTSFTRAYCQFPLCGPSRASIMSGRYPLSNGVMGNGGLLKGSLPTLPQIFRDSGYWTGRVSKIYHMGVPGEIYTGDNGADHPASWAERFNVSVMESLTPGTAEDVMMEDSTPFYDEYRSKWLEMRNKGGLLFIKEGNHQGSDFVIVEADVEDAELADGAAADKAVQLLEVRAKASEPFFLAVGFVRPHVPLVAPRRSFTGYPLDEMRVPEVPEGDLDDMPREARAASNAAKFKLTPEAQKKSLRGYYAAVSYMDEQVGRLLDALDQLGLRENTIVVFMSDHGYHLGEHTMWQKQSLLEECIRVPLIVSAPGQKAPRRKCAAMIELIDVYPTLAELAGIRAPGQIQGKSFARLLDFPDESGERKDALTQTSSGFCLRTEEWAYMRYQPKKGGAKSFMLYDMKNDPGQFTNLAGNRDTAEVESQLEKRLVERITAARKAGRSVVGDGE